MKPRILITSRAETENNKERLYVNKNYVDALYQAGASALVCPFAEENEILEYGKLFDGLLITGGDDTDSKYFKEPLHPSAITEPAYIEDTDMALIYSFLAHQKPILGICRGIQIINVALGGSLIQDLNSCDRGIPENFHFQSKQVPPVSKDSFAHTVQFQKGTIMHTIFGDEYKTNSFHHQALNRIADALTVSGTSADGIVESVEISNRLLAVQWHPERLTFDAKHQRLFTEFVRMCQK